MENSPASSADTNPDKTDILPVKYRGFALAVCEKEGGSTSHGGLTAELQATHNFMTEIFHLTQRAMNTGFFPALVHFQKLQK